MSSLRKRALIKTMLKLTKQWDVYFRSVESSFLLLGIQYPDINDDEIAKAKQEHGMDVLIEEIINVYEEAMTQEDVEKTIDFYSNGPGQKAVNVKFLKSLETASLRWAGSLHKCIGR